MPVLAAAVTASTIAAQAGASTAAGVDVAVSMGELLREAALNRVGGEALRTDSMTERAAPPTHQSLSDRLFGAK